MAAEGTDRAGLSAAQRALLEARLRGRRPGRAERERIPRRVEGTAPLTFAQHGLWLFDRAAPGTPLFNVPQAVRLEGPIDVPALGRALQEIVARQEILRTVFESDGAEPSQVVRPDLEVPLEVLDLSSAPAAERARLLSLIAERDALEPFALSRGPLARFTLLRADEHDHVLLLTMHHIITDGWSFGVLMSELAKLYMGFVDGVMPVLPPLPIQYADYATWERRHFSLERVGELYGSWQRRLGRPTAAPLPTDKPRPEQPSYLTRKRDRELPRGLVQSLELLRGEHGVTPFMVLTGAVLILLRELIGQDELAVGTFVSNRNHTEVEGLIGLFVNTVIIRADLSSDPTLREVLTRVQAATLAALEEQEFPFECFVQEWQREQRDDPRNLFQVMVTAENAMPERLELPGVKLSTFAHSEESPTLSLTSFEWILVLKEHWGQTSLTWTYQTDLFESSTIEKWFDRLFHLLERLTSEPARRLSGLSAP